MERENSTEEIFQIQKYDPVNLKLKQILTLGEKLALLKTRTFSFRFCKFFKNASGGCFFKISNLKTKILLSSENGVGVLI